MVDKLPKMKDMSITPEEREEMTNPSPPRYPYGLCISLGEDELEKLDISEDEVEVGDMLHLHCLAKVTSVSSYDNEHGSNCRVELTLAYIAAESEDEENKKSSIDKLYKKK